MASKNYFGFLSVEVIEQILLQIIRPSDLLSLALTGRRMCTIIIPAFLEYSQLKFSFDRCEVWDHLDGRPVACSRVKHLELWSQRHASMMGFFRHWRKKLITTVPRSVKTSDFEGESLPRSCQKPTINEICGALTKMFNLKQVIFDNSLDVLNYVTCPHKLSALALAVYNSGCTLENIDLSLKFSTQWTVLESKPSLVKMLSDAGWLSSMKTCHLSLIPKHTDQVGPEFGSHLLKTLSLMVNLTHLQLTTSHLEPFWHDDMLYLWPKLEFFDIKDWSPSHPTVVRQFDPEFIARHPRLHTLYLGNPTFVWLPTRSDNQNMASALKSFGYRPNMYADEPVPSKNFPSSIFKNLSHLTFSPTEQNDLKIFDDLDSLESCIITDPSLTKIKTEEIAASIVRGCKNLRKLHFCIPAKFAGPSSDAILSLFQDFQNLTHLFGTVASLKRQYPDLTDALMKRFYKYPQLRYIDYFLDKRDHVPTFVELKRNDALELMSYEMLTDKSTPKSCDHFEWGGFGTTE